MPSAASLDRTVFDRIVIVDWSANAAPKSGKDSIWAAEANVSDGEVRSANLRTRHAAMELLEHITCVTDGRVLVGVDFSLGFPSGTAAALGLARPSRVSMWAELAALVSDDDRNRNNRFEVASALNSRLGQGPGPFWGCPPSQATDHLTSTKVPCDPLPQWRTVEAVLRSRGNRPFSAWQLTGAGAVGSQSLLGIAAMHRLIANVRTSGRSIEVWPFSTGFAVPTADVVLVEIWPTLAATPEVSDDPWDTRVRDQIQVETLATELAAQALGPLFTPAVPGRSVDAVLDEEGWVFGVV